MLAGSCTVVPPDKLSMWLNFWYMSDRWINFAFFRHSVLQADNYHGYGLRCTIFTPWLRFMYLGSRCHCLQQHPHCIWRSTSLDACSWAWFNGSMAVWKPRDSCVFHTRCCGLETYIYGCFFPSFSSPFFFKMLLFPYGSIENNVYETTRPQNHGVTIELILVKLCWFSFHLM